MDHKFKNCPFCGSAVEVLTAEAKRGFEDDKSFDVDSLHFCCSNENCLLGEEDNFLLTNWDELAAVELWNRRPLEETLEKRIGRLERGMEVLLHVLDQDVYPELVAFAVALTGKILKEQWRE